MHKPKFEYPRFYFCKTDGNYTIVHRLSHCYVANANSEEEVISIIKELNSKDKKELWTWLLYDRKIRIPNLGATVKDKDREERESWFLGAWSVYTDLFYTQNPELLVIEQVLPDDTIREIRKDRYLVEKAEAEKVREQQEKQRKQLAEEERQARLALKEKDKVEINEDGKLGSRVSLDRLKKKAKKGTKKLVLKTKSEHVFEAPDSLDPFA